MLILLSLGALASAADTEIGARPFGLGVQLGAPSGITGKVYLGGRTNAIDFSVGTTYGDSFADSLYAHGTYSVHFPALARGGGVTIPWRVGLGGWLANGRWAFGDNGTVIGARAPIGLDFDLEGAPLQFYIEVAAVLSVLPGVDLGVDGGLGARYYF